MSGASLGGRFTMERVPKWWKPRFLVADGVPVDSTGIKLNYVAPEGGARVKRVTTASGGSTAVVQARRDGSAIVLNTGPTILEISLEQGDTIEVFVGIAGAAGSTGDFTISVEEPVF